MNRETLDSLIEKAKKSEMLTMVTAYDYSSATIVDEAGADIILVGDSLGMVIQGCENTLSVTVDHIIYHTQAVVRARKRAFVIADMPFMSYQTGWKSAIKNAGRILSEGGADAVKLEGGRHISKIVKKLVDNGIPVAGHIGLTPQSCNILINNLQGNNATAAINLYKDALALQDAGVFCIVLEKIPFELAKDITASLSVPTIGIGSGVHCSGQVLVFHDLLGLYGKKKFKFVKQYAQLGEVGRSSIQSYVLEVKEKKFPNENHSCAMNKEEFETYQELKANFKEDVHDSN